MLRIDFAVLIPFSRQIIEGEDRGNRTNRHTSAAIDTFHWIDVQLSFRGKLIVVLLRMNAINRAGIYACRIFRSNTGFSNYISHENRALLVLRYLSVQTSRGLIHRCRKPILRALRKTANFFNWLDTQPSSGIEAQSLG